MNTQRLRIPLHPTAEQAARLVALQRAFAEACSDLAGMVQSTRCWNRVALHHMAYKTMRERFPALGSQMVCNAIYAVSRTCRLVYQSKDSPFYLATLGDKPLPRMQFMPTSPVYFDRHTLSLKNGQLSMFTLDGRLKFQLSVGAQQQAMFGQQKLLELVLRQNAKAQFELVFRFEAAAEDDDPEMTPPSPQALHRPMQIPAYVSIAP